LLEEDRLSSSLADCCSVRATCEPMLLEASSFQDKPEISDFYIKPSDL
jgi:hypothetical protein